MTNTVRDSAAAEIAFVGSHAPQIYLDAQGSAGTTKARQDSEEVLAAIHGAYARMAQRINESGVDALVMFALDHVHNLFFNMVPSFTVYTGENVRAATNSEVVKVKSRSDLANNLLDHLLAHDFDPAWSQDLTLDHSFMVPLYYAVQGGLDVPVIPVISNTYIPPQPKISRCYALGREVAAWAAENNLKIATFGSGGMSHYPGTRRYENPDVDADQEVLSWLKAGDISKLAELDATSLDTMGMTELRNWAAAIGARGAGSVPAQDIVYHATSHCGYAVIEF